MIKVFNIHGGVHPAENKHQSTGEAIGTIPLPSEIILPLNQHIGAPAQAIVSVGQTVLKGEKIADAEGVFSATVHASTSGTVAAIEDRPIPHTSGMKAPCIVITPDNTDTWATLSPCENFDELEHHVLVSKIREAGIAGMGGAGFPTAVKLNPRADNKIDTLILNGTECEPYITADDMLMRERASDIIAGAQLLAILLDNPATLLIGIEDNKPEAIAAMRKAATGTKITIVVFPTKYPSGGEKQLIEILTGKQVPSGGIPAQIGIVVQNVGTAVAAYRAVRFGEPLISRVTTVVGESLQSQRNIDVLLGTPVEHILEAHGWQQEQCPRLIIGGPMMGFTLLAPRAPVIKTTNCILAPSLSEMPSQPPAQPCIRCGMCEQACPASLLPQQLFWYAQSENFDQLREHNLFDCIECGACSFVCPSNIPLVQYYRASKSEIKNLDAEKANSDRARLRFEARQARMAQADAEKEAKRVARKAAAEKAKKMQAQKAAAGEVPKDIVSEAVATAKTSAQEIDPAKESAKLERAVSSAESRVARAEKSIAEAISEGTDNARIESLQARLKQAQQKAAEAKVKLDTFTQQQTSVDKSAKTIANKMAASPRAQLEKTITTLEKRITTAQEKIIEAKTNHSPTLGALEQGVTKLTEKLAANQKELAALIENTPPDTSADSRAATDAVPAKNAASAAIERAKAKAAAQAAMSPEEKIREQLKSLEARVAKATLKLQKAEEENDEHIDAFRSALEKLKIKLAATHAAIKEGTV